MKGNMDVRSVSPLDVAENLAMCLQFQCPSCSARLSASTGQPGSIVTCGGCHNDIVVPSIAPPVALPVPTTSVVSLPQINTEPIRDKKPDRGMPLLLQLPIVGVLGLLVAVVVGLIFFNHPSNDGHQGNGPVALIQKAILQAGKWSAAVRPKSEAAKPKSEEELVRAAGLSLAKEEFDMVLTAASTAKYEVRKVSKLDHVLRRYRRIASASKASSINRTSLAFLFGPNGVWSCTWERINVFSACNTH